LHHVGFRLRQTFCAVGKAGGRIPELQSPDRIFAPQCDIFKKKIALCAEKMLFDINSSITHYNIMISNERPSPYGRRSYNNQGYGAPQYGQPYGQSYGQPYGQPLRPPVHEDTLKSGEVQIERKFFTFTLKENPRGRLLRITEDIGGRRNSIIIPATGLAEFKKLLDEMIKASDELPAPAKEKPLDQPE
jgi:hypothetical protein